LSEIVVVGYGTQERAKVTGAISSVSAEEITAVPVISATQALQGRAAGVFVTNSGSPGVDPVVRIRGIGTVGNNNPLYVIDGVIGGGLNEINPADIESIEVLKDASTAAIYGSRGANGVVIITTKRGKSGRPSLDYSGYAGVQNAWKQWDLLNVDQYLDYGTELQTC
jgi:TonB-dependent SusC/RagA subfamily outer membrane receptor